MNDDEDDGCDPKMYEYFRRLHDPWWKRMFNRGGSSIVDFILVWIMAVFSIIAISSFAIAIYLRVSK